ncbi:MAG: surface lipoprotein assembly modifier [Nitrospinae bacterium]|nr:surface lipoprotein assembly modifier [Nitrospinota bacterium]
MAALLVALLLPLEAYAASSEGVGEAAAKRKISNLAFARLLIKAGRFRDARVFLEQARPATEEKKIERRFLLGKVYMRLGMPRKAAEQFEAIFIIRPDLTRVRLELASAQFAAGFDEKAKRHFELSLADGLPSSVENTVEGFIHAIDVRKRWSLHLSAALLPETNAVRRTGNRTVQIGGATFRLNEDAREAPGVGTQLAGGAAFSPRIADDVRGHFALSTAAKLYEKSQWNDISLIGEVGLTRLFDGGALSGGLRAGRRWTGSEGFQSSAGPWASFDRRTSRRIRIRLRTHLDYRKHDERDDLDGWRVSLNPSIRYVLDSRTVLEAGPIFEAIEARKEHRSSRLFGLSGGVSRAFRNGIFVSLSASLQMQRYRATDPLFGMKREDTAARLSIKVVNRSLRFAGFAPYAGYSYEKNRSNISLYEYENHGLLMGLSRDF